MGISFSFKLLTRQILLVWSIAQRSTCGNSSREMISYRAARKRVRFAAGNVQRQYNRRQWNSGPSHSHHREYPSPRSSEPSFPRSIRHRQVVGRWPTKMRCRSGEQLPPFFSGAPWTPSSPARTFQSAALSLAPVLCDQADAPAAPRRQRLLTVRSPRIHRRMSSCAVTAISAAISEAFS